MQFWCVTAAAAVYLRWPPFWCVLEWPVFFPTIYMLYLVNDHHQCRQVDCIFHSFQTLPIFLDLPSGSSNVQIFLLTVWNPYLYQCVKNTIPHSAYHLKLRLSCRYPLLTTPLINVDVLNLFFFFNMSIVHYLPHCPRTEKQAEEEDDARS
jgi:hypothetical protein